MSNADDLMEGIIQLRSSYNIFHKNYSDYLSHYSEEVKNIGLGEGPYTDAQFIKLYKLLEPIPPLNAEINSLHRRANYYEQELKKLKNELNRLKGAN